jgi:hypothetical protein
MTTRSEILEDLKIMDRPQQREKDEIIRLIKGIPEPDIHQNGYLVVGHSKH